MDENKLKQHQEELEQHQRELEIEILERLAEYEKENISQFPGYQAGVREGRSQERGYWIQALSNMKEIDETLLGRIIGKTAKLYEEEYNNVD
ncbi:MAG TPA: hypothetical protein VFD17_00630 [Clostridia bacterium]|nr:hypothetical protein [Clostridia bacterium]